jgi:transcriptional regulator with XRE-family HTH domain
MYSNTVCQATLNRWQASSVTLPVTAVAKPEEFYELLGRRIEDARRKKGLTQSALGGRLKPPHTRASISNIEKGTQRLLVHTLIQLSDALGVAPAELLPVPAQTSSPKRRDVERALKEKLGLPTKELKKLVAQLRTQKE